MVTRHAVSVQNRRDVFSERQRVRRFDHCGRINVLSLMYWYGVYKNRNRTDRESK